jgi:hypothetical protein
LLTPLELSSQLAEMTQENFRGVNAIFEAETNLANAENKLDTIEQKTFLLSEGSVAERNAHARLEASDARFARDVAKAEFNRVKLKVRAIEHAMMSLGTQAKLIAAEMKL